MQVGLKTGPRGPHARTTRVALPAAAPVFQWNRANTIGLAAAACTFCNGTGMRVVYRGRGTPCNCVFRAIFRACLGRFRECDFGKGLSGTVSWEFCGGATARRMYSRKREEFMADFCLLSRRLLSEEDHRLFALYFLGGADWQLCARRFHLDRGNFFHGIYRIERLLGRLFAELQPYPLYPLDEYFGGTVRTGRTVRAFEAFPPPKRNRVYIPQPPPEQELSYVHAV